MRIGSLFAGIGGLELGLEWSGVGHTVWQVEREPFCQRVLAKHWPDAQRFDDVTNVGAHNLPPVDVICGGFPCQDISYAGKGAGLAGARSGLWYEFARIVRELEPRFVVVENVAALFTRGLDAVLGTLADLGYDAEWSCVRASEVGARHRRERVFVVAWLADSKRNGLQEREQTRPATRAAWGRDDPFDMADIERGGLERRRIDRNVVGSSRPGEGAGDQRQWDGNPVSDCGADAGRLGQTDSIGRDRRRSSVEQNPADDNHRRSGAERTEGSGDQGAQAQPGMGGAAHGIPARLDVAGPGEPQRAWEAPRTVTQAQDRAARLKALGNAVVPQVAELVGRRLIAIAEREGLL